MKEYNIDIKYLDVVGLFRTKVGNMIAGLAMNGQDIDHDRYQVHDEQEEEIATLYREAIGKVRLAVSKRLVEIMVHNVRTIPAIAIIETTGQAAVGDGSPAETGQTGGGAPGTGAAGTGGANDGANDGAGETEVVSSIQLRMPDNWQEMLLEDLKKVVMAYMAEVMAYKWVARADALTANSYAATIAASMEMYADDIKAMMEARRRINRRTEVTYNTNRVCIIDEE